MRYSTLAFASICLLLHIPGACGDAWRDTSKHIVRFIEVEPGVRLEVLDWGGSGPPVVLLSGHGDTAHVFDNFAPLLTGDFRVIAVTRRGFGASTQSQNGYELRRLAQDIAEVTAVLKLKRVNLIGHSIAGDEMTRFALTYPENLGKLVYLDAAYDRVEAQRLELRFPKLPSGTDTEAGSPAAVGAFVAQNEIPMPEAEIRATRVFGTDERLLHPVTPDWILRAVAAMVEHPDYKSIGKPILAIYAVYQTTAQFAPRYKRADPDTRLALDRIFALWQPFAKAQRELLRNSVPSARIDEIDGASHYIFISNRERVLRDIRTFLLSTTGPKPRAAPRP